MTATIVNIEAVRVAVWDRLTAAVAAGCPVPTTLYVAKDAGRISASVSDPETVAMWADALGLPAPTMRVYQVEGDNWQRCIEAETRENGVWLAVCHIEAFTATATDVDNLLDTIGGAQ
ncbi:hypothetical protein Lfu02_32520 [Longispora fulva]|uniref:Uncharacterized protein n=1 Tax=Longispora fulva TaxID=619741 RepID=A0A8J7GEX4_9ACTN|nr:hypothetical protein [Longispora fulva]MBG6139383.1 hypothetical protein [Longispora fulva]GIG58880.1 hypothetical protein Lfu02_32520 [Longispora fulva]